MVKEKPILFSAPMVQAILEGRKTQTRRAVKGLDRVAGLSYNYLSCDGGEAEFENQYGGLFRVNCPYGQVGDELWVRETFAQWDDGVAYKADPYCDETRKAYGVKWKPPIFMPRKLSRIQLRITDIRVERLHEISEDDAISEGVEYANLNLEEHEDGSSFVYRFLKLWDKINGENSTDSNPWVWVVEFERVKP